MSAMLFTCQASASKYSPEGIYDPEIYHLDNGLRVILNPRHAARNVSIRLDVGIGNYDFPCEIQETPHFLEHLLFTGTSNHSETELDDIITQHGGYWNAATYDESTVYELDIYSEYSDVGLSTLNEIITDATITKENFILSKDIIYSELGGEPTTTESFLYRHGLVRSASSKVSRLFFNSSRVNCGNLDALKRVRHKNVLDAYNKYYVPNNMTLVVVGDFNSEKIKDQIKQLFGQQSKKNINRDIPRSDDFTQGPVNITGTFKPFLADEGKSLLAYRINGYGSPEYYKLIVVSSYLNERLYEVVRVQEGLSYSPEASIYADTNEGMLLVSAESKLDDIDKVMKLMDMEVNLLRDGNVSDEEINKTIRSELLGWAQGIESNSEIAEYYINSLDELNRYGKFLNQEDILESITPGEVRAVAKEYLDPSRMVYIKSTPTITKNQLYLLIGLLITLILFLAWKIYRRVSLRIGSNLKSVEETV